MQQVLNLLKEIKMNSLKQHVDFDIKNKAGKVILKAGKKLSCADLNGADFRNEEFVF